MTLGDVTKEAKNYKNNFWKLFFVVLLELIITSVLTKLGTSFESSIFSLIYSILIYVITVPLSYGIVITFVKNSRNESFSVFDFVNDGFKNFKAIWKLIGRTILKLLIPIIVLTLGVTIASALITYADLNPEETNQSLMLLGSIALITLSVVFFIYKAISYSLVTYILFDNPELSSKEILERSAELMVGNKFTFIFILLYISALVFLLAMLTLLLAIFINIVALAVLFVGVIILLAYSYSLQTAFYNLLKDNN